MNVQKEFAAVDRRVQRVIEARADDALIRLGFDPVAERTAVQRQTIVPGAEALGQAWRSLVDGMATFAAAFNRGYRGSGS